MVGDGASRPGEGDRLTEVGSSAFSELVEARRTSPVASRPRGSVKADRRGEGGAFSTLDEPSIGLPVDKKFGNELSVGELTGLVEKNGLGGGSEGEGKGDVEARSGG